MELESLATLAKSVRYLSCGKLKRGAELINDASHSISQDNEKVLTIIAECRTLGLIIQTRKYLHKADNLLKDNEFEQALHRYESIGVIGIPRELAIQVMHNKAVCLSRLHLLDLSMSLFQEALLYRSLHSTTIQNIAFLCMARSDYVAALKHFSDVIHIDNIEPSMLLHVLYSAAICRQYLDPSGQHQERAAEAHQAIQILNSKQHKLVDEHMNNEHDSIQHHSRGSKYRAVSHEIIAGAPSFHSDLRVDTEPRDDVGLLLIANQIPFHSLRYSGSLREPAGLVPSASAVSQLGDKLVNDFSSTIDLAPIGSPTLTSRRKREELMHAAQEYERVSSPVASKVASEENSIVSASTPRQARRPSSLLPSSAVLMANNPQFTNAPPISWSSPSITSMSTTVNKAAPHDSTLELPAVSNSKPQLKGKICNHYQPSCTSTPAQAVRPETHEHVSTDDSIMKTIRLSPPFPLAPTSVSGGVFGDATTDTSNPVVTQEATTESKSFSTSTGTTSLKEQSVALATLTTPQQPSVLLISKHPLPPAPPLSPPRISSQQHQLTQDDAHSFKPIRASKLTDVFNPPESSSRSTSTKQTSIQIPTPPVGKKPMVAQYVDSFKFPSIERANEPVEELCMEEHTQELPVPSSQSSLTQDSVPESVPDISNARPQRRSNSGSFNRLPTDPEPSWQHLEVERALDARRSVDQYTITNADVIRLGAIESQQQLPPARDTTKFYAYIALKSPGPFPPDVDVRQREYYLSDADFLKQLKMTKQKWSELPVWRQRSVKQSLGLF